MAPKNPPRAEAVSLAAVTAQLKDFYDEADEALVAVDPFGDICYVNNRAVPFFGRSLPHFLGHPFDEVMATLLDAFDQRQLSPKFKILMADGNPFHITCRLHLAGNKEVAATLSGECRHGLYFMTFSQAG